MSRRRGQRGQASVELALLVPVVVVVLLAVVQVGLLAAAQLQVHHAARAGARAAAVGGDSATVRRAALAAASMLKPDQLTADTSHREVGHHMVSTRVRYRFRTDVALVGALLPDISLQSTAAFRDETGQSASSQGVFRKNSAGTAS